ncbi:MAG: glycosyltransferase [Pseudobdellovibrionaceae bacterium]
MHKQRPLKITIFSEVLYGNGASNAAFRLAHALAKRGQIILYLWSFGAKEGENFPFFDRQIGLGPERYKLYQSYSKKSLLKKIIFRALEWFFRKIERREIRRILTAEKPDLINLHNVSALFDHEDIIELAGETPIIWTLHDQYAFKQYHNQYTNREGQEKTTWEYRFPGQLKPESLNKFKNSNANITFICPSQWLANGLKETFGDKFPVHVLPNIFPSDNFIIMNPAEARQKIKEERASVKGVLEIDPSDIVILFVSDRVQNDLKNFKTLVEAVQILNNPKLKILPVGRATEAYKATLPDFVLPIYYANTPEKIRWAYGASNVVAVCSYIGNLPNVIVEGLLSGRPIVASKVGGIPEMFSEPEHGFFFDPTNPQDVAEKIRRALLQNYEPETLRKYALEQIVNDSTVQRFESLCLEKLASN